MTGPTLASLAKGAWAKTHIDTRKCSDAVSMGFGGMGDPNVAEEGLFVFSDVLDGCIPEIVLQGPGGEVIIVGEWPIEHVRDALNEALRLASKARRVKAR